MNNFRIFSFLILLTALIVSCNADPSSEAQTEQKNKTEQAAKKKNKNKKKSKNKNKNKKKRKEKVPVKFNQQETNVEVEAAPSYPDTYPLYPGCKEEAYEARKRCAQQKMIQDVIRVMKYPQSAVDNEVEGVVVHSFIIEADGTMSDLKLEKSLTPECDLAAKMAIEALMELSGPWEPGTLKGEKQPVRYTLPLSFKNTPR